MMTGRPESEQPGGEQRENTCYRYVDMWALPGIHPANIRLLQLLKSADSQHFTKGMEVIGTLSEQSLERDWVQTHLLGLRSDAWKPGPAEIAQTHRAIKKQRRQWHRQQLRANGQLTGPQAAKLQESLAGDEVWNLEPGDIECRRLILKLFKTTGQTTRWCGTIEEVTSSEIHNSIGSRRNLITLLVILPQTQYVTTIQENHRTFRFPAMFSFSYFDGQRMWYVRLQQRWVSLGPDFDVYIDGTPIGLLDGKLMCFGSDSYLDLANHPLVDDTRFLDLLTLFTASIGYHRAIRRSIHRRVVDTLRGLSHRHSLDPEEIRLRHNGRSAA
jgi:hypothetical protein